MNTYDINSVIPFKKNKDKWGEFSNMHTSFPLRIMLEGVRTSEALYQALRFPHMPEAQKEIIDQASPMGAKFKSFKYKKNNTHPDFVKHQTKIMEWIVRLKVAQHFIKLRPLLAAVDSDIVEMSSKDKFWAVCIDKKDSTKLVGENHLGKIWMKLVEEFKADPSSLKNVPSLGIESMKLYGKSINFKYNAK